MSDSFWFIHSDVPSKVPPVHRIFGHLERDLGVAENIQDRPENATRFVVVAPTDSDQPSGNDKTSLVFSTRHERGALRRALEVFDDAGINLTRIESRPALGRREPRRGGV